MAAGAGLRGRSVQKNRVAYWRKLAAEYHQLAVRTDDPDRRLRLLGAAIRCLQFAEDAALGMANPMEGDPMRGARDEELSEGPGVDDDEDWDEDEEAKDIDPKPTSSLT